MITNLRGEPPGMATPIDSDNHQPSHLFAAITPTRVLMYPADGTPPVFEHLNWTYMNGEPPELTEIMHFPHFAAR